jgi:hypothetical protein
MLAQVIHSDFRIISKDAAELESKFRQITASNKAVEGFSRNGDLRSIFQREEEYSLLLSLID